MEKIKITREQEEVLKNYTFWSNSIERFINKSDWHDRYKALDKFTPEQFALLLCGWYEVEQPFKVGDWVYNKLAKGYRKIINGNLMEVVNWSEVTFGYVLVNTERYEKVIEPWKIMLLELGRDKPEFKVGDIAMTTEHGGIAKHNGQEGSLIIKWAKENRIKYFYPVESRIEVKQ